jgi:hypothetical protein
MKRYAVLLAALAALALAGGASAAAPQGHLDGSVSLQPNIGIGGFIVSGISDGETSFVAVKNDKSNDCNGDTGGISVFYDDVSNADYSIVCAHYTGGAGMAFDYFDTKLNTFVVVFVADGLPHDRVYVGATTNGTLALQWVNRGWAGSGARTLGLAFPELYAAEGLTVTA